MAKMMSKDSQIILNMLRIQDDIQDILNSDDEDKIIEDGMLVMAKNLNKLQKESDRMMSINKEMYSLVKNTYEKSYLNYLYGDATDKDMDTIETVKLYMLNCKKYMKEKK